jgi:hypothetical protein
MDSWLQSFVTVILEIAPWHAASLSTGAVP